jgi:nucleotide-binding universal stress UspA family protein
VYRHIIVAVDGSTASTQALQQATHLALHNDAMLTGVFIMDGKWADFIGNDWQSSKGARQGFLDYIQKEQEQQAKAAREQFELASTTLKKTAFELLIGDPTEELLKLARAPSTDLMVLCRRVFQVSGRPSLKSLAKTLAQQATRPLLLLS